MDLIKTINLILDNPANNLTTTSRDLLDTMKVHIELNYINKEDLLLKANQMAKENDYLIDNTGSYYNYGYHKGINIGINRIINLIERTTK